MFDWMGFHQIATYLNDQAAATGSPEAARRTAISRAYYAAYNIAREVADNLGFVFDPSKGFGEHDSLQRWYSDPKGTGFDLIIDSIAIRVHCLDISKD